MKKTNNIFKGFRRISYVVYIITFLFSLSIVFESPNLVYVKISDEQKIDFFDSAECTKSEGKALVIDDGLIFNGVYLYECAIIYGAELPEGAVLDESPERVISNQKSSDKIFKYIESSYDKIYNEILKEKVKIFIKNILMSLFPVALELFIFIAIGWIARGFLGIHFMKDEKS